MRVTPRELTPVTGPPIAVPDPERLIHLQFRRFAGCPKDEIEAAGVREILVFHSPAEELREHDLPFPVIADPGKKLYVEFGVESSPRALVSPGAWLPIATLMLAAAAVLQRAPPRAGGWGCPPTS